VRPVDLVVIQVTHENERVAAFPDPHSLARDELTSLLKELTSREEAISEERRTLHAQIGVLRRELVDRLRDEGDTVICGADFLDPGSAGVREPPNPRPEKGSDGIALAKPPDPDVESDTPPCREPPTG
jgi:hypothetical protein